ncbi:polysaccharide pyruvyl transferase family protein [Bacteroides sp. BFG-551]|nr:polysaccharide pyruvyl transferase family protein [Bacteroides sp. BFG-551]
MNAQEKIKELRAIINKELLPLIDHDYVYLDLPYHPNIGDTLIWEGTCLFLKQTKYKCLYSTDIVRYIPKKWDIKTLIFLHGGGNWGDLYREHEEFRKKIIQSYPNNKIIIFPQTVFYENTVTLNEDMAFYSHYPNVIICARDRTSYDFLKKYLSNNTILLVPDMAFFIDAQKYSKGEKKGRTLYLERTDKELVKDGSLNCIPQNAEKHDWPTYEIVPLKYKLIDIAFGIPKRVIQQFDLQIAYKITDFKRKHFYRMWYVKSGIHFLDKYEKIYTTRLHVMILGILLNKKIYVVNNTSGKIFNFYNTWLNDLKYLETIEPTR